MADELTPYEKVSISGPALSCIIQRFAASYGDADGLLFGHVAPLPPPDPDDDNPSPYSTGGASTLFAASITSSLSSASPMSFYDPLGRINPAALSSFAAAAAAGRRGSYLLGWFSCRRRSPLRPSMRELAVSVSLCKTLNLASHAAGDADRPPRPSVFLLLSSFFSPNQAVHTHDYRAFVLRPSAAGGALEARSLTVSNVGPAFRAQYLSFSPQSALPLVPFPPKGIDGGEGGQSGPKKKAESINGLKQSALEKNRLEAFAAGFGLERLERLVGPSAAQYSSDLEELYRKMLQNVEDLAASVDMSSARVLEQENINLKLRSKAAGLE